jgi:hypothetical protein
MRNRGDVKIPSWWSFIRASGSCFTSGWLATNRFLTPANRQPLAASNARSSPTLSLSKMTSIAVSPSVRGAFYEIGESADRQTFLILSLVGAVGQDVGVRQQFHVRLTAALQGDPRKFTKRSSFTHKRPPPATKRRTAP